MSVDFSQLPKPNFVDEIDYEQILAERKAFLISLYPPEEQDAITILCSWRHTPFRNVTVAILFLARRSWRHTPFRNENVAEWVGMFGSWRHTPFRKPEVRKNNTCTSSWRHTPFRNARFTAKTDLTRSWRHTPFRKALTFAVQYW